MLPIDVSTFTYLFLTIKRNIVNKNSISEFLHLNFMIWKMLHLKLIFFRCSYILKKKTKKTLSARLGSIRCTGSKKLAYWSNWHLTFLYFKSRRFPDYWIFTVIIYIHMIFSLFVVMYKDKSQKLLYRYCNVFVKKKKCFVSSLE